MLELGVEGYRWTCFLNKLGSWEIQCVTVGCESRTQNAGSGTSQLSIRSTLEELSSLLKGFLLDLFAEQAADLNVKF